MMRAVVKIVVGLFAALVLCAPAFGQVGGATALPPSPDQIAANQLPDPAFNAGNFTGWSYPASCASVVTSPVPPGTTYAARLTGCAGGNPTVFENTAALHNHEALLIRWQGYASADYVGTGISVSLFDNNHGDGSILWSTGRDQIVLTEPSSAYTTNFVEFYPNIAEHGSDTDVNVRFNLNSPAWPGSNNAESVGYEIVDPAGNAEEVTTTGSTGSSAPSWNATQGGTTSDGTITWTNEGPNPPFYVTNVEVAEEWFPLRTFLLYPNYHGYLWSDLVPPKRYAQIQPVSAGSPFYNFEAASSSPVAGEVMGVSTIDPPPADSLSQLTLTVTLATAAGCASGVLATDTFNSPQSVQPWQLTPSQYGSLTLGSAYYVCSSLYVTSGMSLVDSYPDWKIYYENAAFRNALINWYDPNNLWYHDGQPELLIGTYDRMSSYRRNGTPATLGDYEREAGLTSNTAPSVGSFGGGGGSEAPQLGDVASDYCAQGFTGVMSSFNIFSGTNPTGAPTSDQLTPWLELMSACGSDGVAHWQILNNWAGYLVNEDSVSAAPAFLPTVSATSGSISANYLFLEAVALGAPISQGNSPARLPGETPPSTALTVNLSSATCAGANCGVTFTMPSCPDSRWLGWHIFAATGATSAPPANSSFARQVPLVSGMLGSGGVIPCGAMISLTSLASGPPPPTADSTYNFRPLFASATQTDAQTWNLLFTAMNNSTYAKGVGGMYLADEPSFYSMPWLWEMEQQLYANNPNLPVSCVLVSPGITELWRDVCDLIGEDPYGYDVAPAPDEYATGESSTQNCSMYGPNNTVTIEPQCFRSRVDVYTDDAARGTFGARPSWNVIQQFGNSGTYAGFPYYQMKTQIWKAIIDCQAYGSLGCDAITWGWVDSSGMDQTVLSPAVHTPAAWYDSKRATSELRALIPVLDTPVEDSPILGTRNVVSGVLFSVSAATACSIQSGQTSMYTNAALWPDAPANFVTHTDPATGDQYIFANNLCSASAPFSATFGLANPPKGATEVEVVNEGRTLPISTTSCPNVAPACFTDSAWQQDDTHIYAIRALRGAYVH